MRSPAGTLLLLAALGCGGRAFAATWPMEGGNADRWNQALAPSGVRLPLSANWVSATGNYGGPYGGPMVMPQQVLINWGWFIQSMDRSSGALQWTFFASGPDGNDEISIPETPTYDPDRNVIYTSDGAGNTYGVSPTGQTLWVHSDEGDLSPRSAPLYANNEIYAPSGGNGLICLDPDSQAVVWRCAATEGYTLLSPTLDSGRLYVPTLEGAVFCLNASDGSVVWELDTGLEEDSAILVQGSYFYRNCSLGLVECRNTSDGSLVWTYQCDSFGSSDMAFSGGLLIVANDDRHVRALDASTGQVIWDQAFVGNFARCAPIIVCDQILISGCAGQYYGLDAQNGDTLWTYNYANQNAFTDWALADGHLYTADAEGNLYDFISPNPGSPSDCGSPQAWTQTTTPTEDLSLSPTPSFTRSPTPSVSSTASDSPTASRTPTISTTPSISPSPTIGTSSPTPTETFLPGQFQNPTPAPPGPGTDVGTPAPAATATPSLRPSFSETDTPTGTASASTTATSSATPGVSLTESDTQTSTPSATSSPSQAGGASPTASPTAEASPDALVTASAGETPILKATPGDGSGSILRCLPAPNPNPLRLDVLLDGPADCVTVTVWTAGMVLVGRRNWGPAQAGWNSLPTDGLFQGLPQGLYYALARPSRGGRPAKPALAKVFLLR